MEPTNRYPSSPERGQEPQHDVGASANPEGHRLGAGRSRRHGPSSHEPEATERWRLSVAGRTGTHRHTTLSRSAMQAYNPLKPGGIMQIYRVSEVAQMLGVHPNKVRKWVREEILRPVKVPGSDYSHFTLDELNRLRQQVGLPLVEDQE
jgi:excisionase family DNA binding protein